MLRLASHARVVAISWFVASSAGRPEPTRHIRASATTPTSRAPQRLFSAWLEGQIAYRGLPGIVVGVVADQQLVWARDSASPTSRRSGR